MNRTHRLMFENAVASAIGSQRVIRDGGTEEGQVFTLEEADVQGVAENLLTWWEENYEVEPTLETAEDYFDKIYCPHGGEREDGKMKKEWGGHTWKTDQLGDESWSVLCLDPSFDDDGIDYTVWPSDEEVSAWVGIRVIFSDAGDHPEYPEAIFAKEGREMKIYQSVEAAAKAAGPADRVYWRHHSWENIEYILCPAGEEDELVDDDWHLVSDEEVEACLWEWSFERQALID